MSQIHKLAMDINQAKTKLNLTQGLLSTIHHLLDNIDNLIDYNYIGYSEYGGHLEPADIDTLNKIKHDLGTMKENLARIENNTHSEYKEICKYIQLGYSYEDLIAKRDDSNHSIDEELETEQIEKVQRKIPKWIRKPDDVPHTFISAFLELEKNQGEVHKDDLKTACEKRGIDKGKFNGNYSQLKNIRGSNNHGKVFHEDKKGYVTLWDPIAKDIREQDWQ